MPQVSSSRLMPQQSHSATRSWRTAVHRCQSLLWLPGLYPCLPPRCHRPGWIRCRRLAPLTYCWLQSRRSNYFRAVQSRNPTPSRIPSRPGTQAGNQTLRTTRTLRAVKCTDHGVLCCVASASGKYNGSSAEYKTILQPNALRSAWAVLLFVAKDGIMGRPSKQNR